MRVASAAAAGAEEDDQGNDEDPGAVIIKKMAKAVIHQKVLRKNSLRGDFPLRYHSMAARKKRDRNIFIPFRIECNTIQGK